MGYGHKTFPSITIARIDTVNRFHFKVKNIISNTIEIGYFYIMDMAML